MDETGVVDLSGPRRSWRQGGRDGPRDELWANDWGGESVGSLELGSFMVPAAIPFFFFFLVLALPLGFCTLFIASRRASCRCYVVGGFRSGYMS